MAPPLSRFLTPYHALNAVLLVSYPAFLGAWAKSAFPANVENLVTWEKQTAATSFAVLLVKFLRCDTLDGWIADVFAYGKSSLAVLAYFADPSCRLLAWHLVVCLVLWVFVPVPSVIRVRRPHRRPP